MRYILRTVQLELFSSDIEYKTLPVALYVQIECILKVKGFQVTQCCPHHAQMTCSTVLPQQTCCIIYTHSSCFFLIGIASILNCTDCFQEVLRSVLTHSCAFAIVFTQSYISTKSISEQAAIRTFQLKNMSKLSCTAAALGNIGEISLYKTYTHFRMANK